MKENEEVADLPSNKTEEAFEDVKGELKRPASPRRYSFEGASEDLTVNEGFKTSLNLNPLKSFKEVEQTVPAPTPRTITTYRLSRENSPQETTETEVSPLPASVSVLIDRARTYSSTVIPSRTRSRSSSLLPLYDGPATLHSPGSIISNSTISMSAVNRVRLNEFYIPDRMNSAPLAATYSKERNTSPIPRPHSVSLLDPGRPNDLSYSLVAEPLSEEIPDTAVSWIKFREETITKPLKDAESSSTLAPIYQELAKLDAQGDKESLKKVYAALDAYRKEHGIPARTESPASSLSRKFSMVMQKSSSSVKRSLTIFGRKRGPSDLTTSPTVSPSESSRKGENSTTSESDFEENVPVPPQKSLDRMKRVIVQTPSEPYNAKNLHCESPEPHLRQSEDRKDVNLVFAQGPVKESNFFKRISAKITTNFRKK